MNPISGLHHVTAIASNPQRNLDFYTEVLGLRLVKRTVNFDDPETYHFYFGSDLGAPGSILTFFPWAGAPRGTTGTGETSATAFRAPVHSLDYWLGRLLAASIPVEHAGLRFGDPVLRFRDPDGMALEIVGVNQPTDLQPSRWSNVPTEHALSGFFGVTLALRKLEASASVLQTMGFQLLGVEENRHRFVTAGDAPGRIVDLVADPQGSMAQLGAGSVHHIAFRVTDDADQLAWSEHLTSAGLHPTPVRDRVYFHSIYFREPGGVLFELATDPPGFTADESAQSMGESLKLPPWIEDHRSLLEKVLPPVELPHLRTGALHE